MSTPIMPGAEAVSVTGGTRGGVLLIHGYTATPQQVRTWAHAFAQAGFSVEAPLLPGHGTDPDEMLETAWSDYLAAADEAYQNLVAKHGQVFIGGLCLGCHLGAQLAIQYPETTAGLLVINAPFKTPNGGTPDHLRNLIATGKQFFTWSTNPKQIEDPDATPVLAYNKVPILPMPSMIEACIELHGRLNEIICPVIVFTSKLDWSSNHKDVEPWINDVSGPVEEVILERSNHVATLDYDKDILEQRSVEFALAIVNGQSQTALQAASIA